MKRKFLLLTMSLSLYGIAQVGINTTDPKATLDIKEEAVDLVNPTQVPQGVSFPNFTTEERATFRNVKEGTLIYNTTKKCIEMYQGLENSVPQWTCITASSTSGGGTNPGTGTATISDKVHYVAYANHQGTVVKGKINNGAEKITLEIPYTNGQGDYNAVNITQTTAPGRGGDTNPLTLKIQPSTFNSTGNITASIEVGGDGEYKLKQLAPNARYDIATFNVDINGSNFRVVLKGIGGIADKNFDDGSHDFMYLPVQVTARNGYSKTWLNMNLGAEAAKVGSSNFNPTLKLHGEEAHQKQSLYGSLYQWQRPTDGHEIRTSQPAPGYANSWQATSPSGIVGKFIVNSNSNWVANGSNDISGPNVHLWEKNKTNNPCPQGYHVPSRDEWQEFRTAVKGGQVVCLYCESQWDQTLLPNMSAGGKRAHDTGALEAVGSWGQYWTSTGVDADASIHFFADQVSGHKNTKRSEGASVRCIKD